MLQQLLWIVDNTLSASLLNRCLDLLVALLHAGDKLGATTAGGATCTAATSQEAAAAGGEAAAALDDQQQPAAATAAASEDADAPQPPAADAAAPEASVSTAEASPVPGQGEAQPTCHPASSLLGLGLLQSIEYILGLRVEQARSAVGGEEGGRARDRASTGQGAVMGSGSDSPSGGGLSDRRSDRVTGAGGGGRDARVGPYNRVASAAVARGMQQQQQRQPQQQRRPGLCGVTPTPRALVETTPLWTYPELDLDPVGPAGGAGACVEVVDTAVDAVLRLLEELGATREGAKAVRGSGKLLRLLSRLLWSCDSSQVRGGGGEGERGGR